MWSSLLVLLPVLGLPAQATESYAQISGSSRKRQLQTCDETYGNGSIPCGGQDSTWCFNPSIGQTCCPLDRGFCSSGSYCAPVAGYCCFEGEDLVTCARNAGFDLPQSGIATPDSSTATSTGISRTFTVSPFLTPDPKPTLSDTADLDAEPAFEPFTAVHTEFVAESSVTCHDAPSFTNPVVVQIANTSAPPPMKPSKPISPVVQVSIAVKKNRPVLTSIVMGAMASILTIAS
ncbi:hypothetical protein GGR51DRAFT_563359 [Nemania sp. FL0031]|nr:hypothetical protein GGR51DRAFT_563359 [Nemania sp. FL0031]